MAERRPRDGREAAERRPRDSPEAAERQLEARLASGAPRHVALAPLPQAQPDIILHYIILLSSRHNRMVMKTMQQLMTDGGKCIWVAPSGGRDRPSDDGKYEVAPFDSKSIEMFRLMSAKADGTATSGQPRGNLGATSSHLEPSRVICARRTGRRTSTPSPCSPTRSARRQPPSAGRLARGVFLQRSPPLPRRHSPTGSSRVARRRAADSQVLPGGAPLWRGGGRVALLGGVRDRQLPGWLRRSRASSSRSAEIARDEPGWPEIGELVARRAARGDTS